MLKTNINTVYTAKTIYSGTSSKGDWEMVVMEAEGSDKARMPVWIVNVPSGITEGSKFMIESITGAAIRHIKPSERFDKWQDEFSINAVVKPVMG